MVGLAQITIITVDSDFRVSLDFRISILSSGVARDQWSTGESDFKECQKKPNKVN